MKGAALLSATLLVLGAFAEEMLLNPLFSDNMVFAAGKPLRVFGNGDGDAVVRIGGREARAQSADGSWVAELPGTLNVGKAYVLEVVLNGKLRTLHNVRMGEVWLMSGQSNMQFKLSESDTPEECYVDDPLLRHLAGLGLLLRGLLTLLLFLLLSIFLNLL